MIVAHKSIRSLRRRSVRINACLGLSIVVILVCLIRNQAIVRHSKGNAFEYQYAIDRIRDVAVRAKQSFSVNVTYHLTANYPPKWIEQYRLRQFFNFHRLQNGAYRWYLQRLLDMQVHVDEPRMNLPGQVFHEHFDRQQTFVYLQHHPERGVVIDSAPDPVQALFAPLPRADVPLENLSTEFRWLRQWYPCHTRLERIHSEPWSPSITYALCNVTIDDGFRSPSSQTHHSNESIHLVHSEQQASTQLGFVRQFLPRLIRLLALVPSTAPMLVPFLNTNVYIGQHLDILVERGLVANKQRFISYNASVRYHADAVYSTSTRTHSHHRRTAARNGVRRHRSSHWHVPIFRRVRSSAHLSIQERIESYQTNRRFISTSSHRRRHAHRSSLVWCQPDTHMIEIIQEHMTADYYEMSLQLNLHYWPASVTRTKQIDTVDFRNVMLKVLTNMDR